MGTDAKEIAYRKSEWFDGARELIQRSECGTVDDLDYIENQIRSGALLLYRVEINGELIGIFTAHSETIYNGHRELVVVHAVSVEQQPFAFIPALDPVITALAAQSGFDSWRVHAQRPGMMRVLASHGFTMTEAIFTKQIEVPHG